MDDDAVDDDDYGGGGGGIWFWGKTLTHHPHHAFHNSFSF